MHPARISASHSSYHFHRFLRSMSINQFRNALKQELQLQLLSRNKNIIIGRDNQSAARVCSCFVNSGSVVLDCLFSLQA